MYGVTGVGSTGIEMLKAIAEHFTHEHPTEEESLRPAEWLRPQSAQPERAHDTKTRKSDCKGIFNPECGLVNPSGG